VAGGLILIVEDNERNLKLVGDLLRAHGHETVEARSGEEALELVRARRPELVLMDVQLPGMDGVATLRELRARPELARTPVVAVTAYAMVNDRERLLAAGFDDYVEKPIDVRTLPARVRGHLERAGEGAAT
jgi:two-component system cell cycle response regulator DivK